MKIKSLYEAVFSSFPQLFTSHVLFWVWSVILEKREGTFSISVVGAVYYTAGSGILYSLCFSLNCFLCSEKDACKRKREATRDLWADCTHCCSACDREEDADLPVIIKQLNSAFSSSYPLMKWIWFFYFTSWSESSRERVAYVMCMSMSGMAERWVTSAPCCFYDGLEHMRVNILMVGEKYHALFIQLF